jgi:hypothetical protein
LCRSLLMIIRASSPRASTRTARAAKVIMAFVPLHVWPPPYRKIPGGSQSDLTAVLTTQPQTSLASF